MEKTPNSALNRISNVEFKEAKKIPLTVALDNVRSALNVGSVFRSSDAFRIKEVLLGGITPTPPHRDIQKTALGATDSVTWQSTVDLVESLQDLKSKGYTILAVEQATNAISLNEFVFEADHNYILVFGHEVKGVSTEVMNIVDGAIEIPQMGTKHSINISVSAGIVLWEAFKQLKTNL